jgi:hypothetical protein
VEHVDEEHLPAPVTDTQEAIEVLPAKIGVATTSRWLTESASSGNPPPVAPDACLPPANH